MLSLFWKVVGKGREDASSVFSSLSLDQVCSCPTGQSHHMAKPVVRVGGAYKVTRYRAKGMGTGRPLNWSH